MVERNLTAEEFWQLSPEERLKRCGELSDHEAFAMRVTAPMFSEPTFIPCNVCIHRIGKEPACKAHPDGITSEHIDAVIEDQTIICGNGFHFEKAE